MKFLVAEECKQCENYIRMYDMCKEACLYWKNVSKWAKYGFATMNLSENDSS